jgi:CMP-N-acetylneuraminic acid synthetase
MNIIALIPARAGSVRIPGKNMKLLAGQPLLAYTIAAAKQSGVFSGIVVSTDHMEAYRLAQSMNASSHWRAPEHATEDSPDIEWVLNTYRRGMFFNADAFSILRPTSPFRSAETIRRAYHQFDGADADSIRGVTAWHGHHPGKMWIYDNASVRLHSVMSDWTAHAPYHSSPTQSLIPIVKQTAALEMAWTRVLHQIPPTISGTEIAPFWMDGAEAHDLNTLDDWAYAEAQIAAGQWTLPPV